MRVGVEEVTVELLRKMNEISDAVHKTETSVAIISTQIIEREKREVDSAISQEKELLSLRDTQTQQGKEIEALKANSNKISGAGALVYGIVTVVNLVIAGSTLVKTWK